MRRSAASLLLALLAGACAPKGSLRPPELEAAHRQMMTRPDDGETYMNLARLYFAQKDMLRARQYLEVAERLTVRDPAARFRLGLDITLHLGLYDDAVVRIRRQIERREDPQLRLLLASVYEGMARYSDAELERRLVLEARPQDAHLMLETARFYQRWRSANQTRAEADPRALELLRRCLSQAPQGPDAPQARALLRSLEL